MYYFEDEFETVKKTTCRCCEANINRGDWAYEDGYRNVFCSIECVKEYHEVKEITCEDM